MHVYSKPDQTFISDCRYQNNFVNRMYLTSQIYSSIDFFNLCNELLELTRAKKDAM